MVIRTLRPFFIPMIKQRYQRYEEQSDNSIYDTYLLPASEAEI